MKSKFFLGAGLFALGVAAGGYLFAQTQPRSFLALSECAGACYRSNELAGLLVSAGIHAGAIAPIAVMETGRCIAIEHPAAAPGTHFVVFPKRDVKDIGDLTSEDAPYVLDCLALMGELVRTRHLRHYWVTMNGPALQDVRYLHFHLEAPRGGTAAAGAQ